MKKLFFRHLKKYFIITLLFLFLTPWSVCSAAVFNCSGGGCGADGGLRELFSQLTGTGIIQSDNLILVILGWVKFALALMGVIAFVTFVWAGFLYITAFAGGEENTKTAKKILIWTSIGIILILVSYAIVSTLIRATT